MLSLPEDHLHSIMYLLIHTAANEANKTVTNLHSIMYLLIRGKCGKGHKYEEYLHSIMYLLILELTSETALDTSFTFHNVSINSSL